MPDATHEEIMKRLRREENIFFKERREVNKDKIPEEYIYIHNMVNCPCGGCFMKKYLGKHLETKMHKKWLAAKTV